MASLDSGPSVQEFSFTFQERENTAMLDELGRTLVNLSRVVPAGVVCFFPSFAFVTKVMERWGVNGPMEAIRKKKKVFVEPRETSLVEQTLAAYEKFIKHCQQPQQQPQPHQVEETGAILFSVVGGKMSEGINFSDDLGRCVIVVGMPYPNMNSPELSEKMKYLDSTPSGSARVKDEPSGGELYYENLCMKAVNQSIGRAIRHIGDHAAILLLDRRYSRPRIQSKLPKWIGDRLLPSCTFQVAFREIAKVRETPQPFTHTHSDIQWFFFLCDDIVLQGHEGKVCSVMNRSLLVCLLVAGSFLSFCVWQILHPFFVNNIEHPIKKEKEKERSGREWSEVLLLVFLFLLNLNLNLNAILN